MDKIDLGEFVFLMRPELERMAELAICKQGAVEPILKSDYHEIAIEHEPDSKSRIGVASVVDLEIQELLLKFVYERWPFISVLVEENTDMKAKFRASSPYCLLIDPIDGSKNYLAGGSEFCHIVSLMRGKTMLVSMVYSHSKKQLFITTAGRGVQVFSHESSPEPAVLRSRDGNIFLCHVSRIALELKHDLRGLGYDVRPSSQNATDILSMLDGGTVGFISLTPVIYDVWSPAMIIQEAGGWLSDWVGAPLQFGMRTRLPHVLVTTSEGVAGRTLPVLKKYVPRSNP